MERIRNGTARSGLLAFTLWGAALGAAGGCAVGEELEAAPSGEGEAQGEAERALADAEVPVVRRYVPMAFFGDLAGPATTTSAAAAWRTAFTIHNPSLVHQRIRVAAYNGAGVIYTRPAVDVPAGGAGSFQLDGGNVPLGFEGAVMLECLEEDGCLEGSAELEVTAVQLPVQSTVANRPVVNATSRPSVLLHFPIVMRAAGGRTTRLYLHNTRPDGDTLHFYFYDESGTPRCSPQRTLARPAGVEYDLLTEFSKSEPSKPPECAFPPSWTGTLTVESTDGQIVGASMLVDAAGTRVSGLEAVPLGLDPSFPAVVRSYPGNGSTLSSSIALQNFSPGRATFTLEFRSKNVNDPPTSMTGTIPAHGRATISTSMLPPAVMPPGFIGSARYFGDGSYIAAASTVTRDDGAPDFEAVSPANSTGDGVGPSEGIGARLSLPYVRHTATPSNTRPQTHIAIQNVGSSRANVSLRYYGRDGAEVTACGHQLWIEPGRKKNASPPAACPAEFGYVPAFGGSVIVESLDGAGRLGAVVRVAGTTIGEDYTGIPIPF